MSNYFDYLSFALKFTRSHTQSANLYRVPAVRFVGTCQVSLLADSCFEGSHFLAVLRMRVRKRETNGER